MVTVHSVGYPPTAAPVGCQPPSLDHLPPAAGSLFVSAPQFGRPDFFFPGGGRGSRVCLCPGDPPTSGPPLGPLRHSFGLSVRTGDRAPRGPALGPLQHNIDGRLRPGDPAPSGPPPRPLGPSVERSGGPGKGRTLGQNRGGPNQGRRHRHRAALLLRDRTQAHAPPAPAITTHGMVGRRVWTAGRRRG